MDWAVCVENFMNFEGACGYGDEGMNVPTTDRPAGVKWWLARGRKWDKTVDLGELGAVGSDETFIDHVLKKDSRGQGGGGMMTVPAECDWSTMEKWHGKNGILQVMASLLWWGERVEAHPLDTARWSSAVDEVSYVLGEITAAVKKG
ncbi:hypothetical protein C8R43DRAFT_878769 [Mycena crocata]|nr:hypothetical protein C8R43DRAFT_878769 [Mycena crocata]